MDIKVIGMEDEHFYRMVEEIVSRLAAKMGAKPRDRWIDGEEAMEMLRIKSKTTLQKLRDTGAIRYTQPDIGVILYDTKSIEAYLEKNAKNTF